MREMKKADAVRQYGLHYSTPLARLDLSPKRGTTPATELLLKLEKFNETFDGTLSVVEHLGMPVETYQYKDLADVQRALGAEKREELKAQLQEFVVLYASESSLTSDQPEIASKLKQAWDNAVVNMSGVKDFLDSGRDFKVNVVQPLPETLRMPEVMAQPGDKAYTVTMSDTIIPTLGEATVKSVSFMRTFFREGEITARYEIDSPRKSVEKVLYSGDAKGDLNAPFAAASRSAAYNTEAAAKAHIGAAMNAQERKLKADLKELRKARKGLGL